MNRHRSFFIMIGVFVLCTCIDPYNPQLKGYSSLLVVDGLVTDEKLSYKIKLSRTFQDVYMAPEMVADANVFISDGKNNNYTLINSGKGIYKSDSLQFVCKVGENYTLHIQTGEGEEYVSESCTMYPVSDIDSIYYQKDQELTNNATENQSGIRIFCSFHAGDNSYLRWSFEETWKFKVPFPKKYNYIDSAHIIILEKIREVCWKNRKADEILISNNSVQTDKNCQEPIFFIVSDQSDRLLMTYSILVKQYSISKKEYEFWVNMKKVGDMGGDIFAAQPFSVISNISNVKNPKERVLGYFQVSAVKQKRKYIYNADIMKLELPLYHYPCERIARGPMDYPGPGRYTFDNIYYGFPPTTGIIFVEPIYNPLTRELERLVFTRVECANCELTGTSGKPDFWND